MRAVQLHRLYDRQGRLFMILKICYFFFNVLYHYNNDDVGKNVVVW